MDFTVPEFDIERNRDRCTLCGACVKECSYKVHFFSKDKKPFWLMRESVWRAIAVPWFARRTR